MKRLAAAISLVMAGTMLGASPADAAGKPIARNDGVQMKPHTIKHLNVLRNDYGTPKGVNIRIHQRKVPKRVKATVTKRERVRVHVGKRYNPAGGKFRIPYTIVDRHGNKSTADIIIDPRWDSLVYVVGDSITHRSRQELRARRPNWDIDAVPGRRVTALPTLMRRRAKMPGNVRHLIIALGSNVDPKNQWSREDYRKAADTFGPNTTVTFTTMWRDRNRWPNAARIVKKYSRYVGQIQNNRPLTCYFHWRKVAVKRPWLIADGVHPTARGERVWARGVSNSVGRCVGKWKNR